MVHGDFGEESSSHICGKFPTIRKIILSRDLLSTMVLSGAYFSNRREITTDGITILLFTMAHGDFGEGDSDFIFVGLARPLKI